MKFVIAPDSFKESLSALDAARAIATGLKTVYPTADYDLVPMADGGEGTVDAMVEATGGTFVTTQVTGPLGQPVDARWGLLGDGTTAVLEMAAASGLPLVRLDQRNPMFTTTRGTGDLIRAALDRGIKKIILGIGGSATVDGGAGMVQALGVKLLDDTGHEIPPGGRGLKRLTAIDTAGLDPRIAGVELLVASDVDNPLTGARGAARVFGPQKGATPEMVEILDQNLHHFAQVVRDQMGKDYESAPGAGAAGGLGFALLAFCGARLESGSRLVAQTVGLPDRLNGATLCLTGEGRIDGQSVHGKVCFRVAELARQRNVPAIALVGSVGKDADQTIPPLAAYFSICNKPMTLDEAIENAGDLLTGVAAQLARTLSLKL